MGIYISEKNGNNKYNEASAKVKGKMMRRFSVFDGAGEDLTDCEHLDEVLTKAKLDYSAVKCKTFYMPEEGPLAGQYIENPAAFTFAKSDNLQIPLGTNGKQYTAVGNRLAFDVADEIVQEGNARYEVGGPSLGAKNTVDYAKSFLVLRGDDFEIGDDTYNTFLAFNNSFDGSSGVSYQVLCQRLVCLNGMTRYLGGRESQTRITIQHSHTAESRIQIAREVVKKRLEEIKLIQAEAEAFIGTKMTKEEFQKNIIPLVLKEMKLVENDKERERGHERIAQVVQDLLIAYEMDDVQNYANSAYRTILALADYETHAAPLRDTQNPHLYLNRIAKGMLLTSAVAKYIAATKGIQVRIK